MERPVRRGRLRRALREDARRHQGRGYGDGIRRARGEAPGSGLGLDSIDVLELVGGLEKTYGVTIPDHDTGQRVLRPVTTIAEYVKASGRKL